MYDFTTLLTTVAFMVLAVRLHWKLWYICCADVCLYAAALARKIRWVLFSNARTKVRSLTNSRSNPRVTRCWCCGLASCRCFVACCLQLHRQVLPPAAYSVCALAHWQRFSGIWPHALISVLRFWRLRLTTSAAGPVSKCTCGWKWESVKPHCFLVLRHSNICRATNKADNVWLEIATVWSLAHAHIHI